MTDEGVRRVRVLGLWGPFSLCASYMRSREVRFLVNFKFTRMCWCVCVCTSAESGGATFPMTRIKKGAYLTLVRLLRAYSYGY